MALITDFLAISDALDAQREKPFEFRQRRFDEFKNQSDGIRETFVENQRVPERLSATRLNDRTNQFNLQDLNQNFDRNLETSALNSQFGLNNTRFNLSEQPNVQERQRTETRAGTIANNNSILSAEAEQEYTALVQALPFNNNDDPKEYVSRLLNETQNPQTRDLIKEEAQRIFQPETNAMNTFASAYDRFLGLPDTTGTGDNVVPNRAKIAAQAQLERQLANMNWDNLQYMADNGLMSREEIALFDQLQQFRPEDVQPVTEPVAPAPETAQSPTGTTFSAVPQPAPRTSIARPQQVPAIPEPTAPSNVPEAIISPEISIIEPSNELAKDLIASNPEVYGVLNEGLTRDNYEQVDQVLESILKRPNGPEILSEMGLTPSELQEIAAQVDQYAEMDRGVSVENTPAINPETVSPQQLRAARIASLDNPELIQTLSQTMTFENFREFEDTIADYLEETGIEQGIANLESMGVDITDILQSVENFSNPSENGRSDLEISRIQFPEDKSLMEQLMAFNSNDPSEANELFDRLIDNGVINDFADFDDVMQRFFNLAELAEQVEFNG